MNILHFKKNYVLNLRCKLMYVSFQRKIHTGVETQERVRAESFENIPGPFCVPFIGNLYQYKLGIYDIFKYHNVLRTLYRKYGPIVKEKFGSKVIIHLFSPDDAKTIYQNEDKMPFVAPLQETIQLYRKTYKFSPGLGNTNGETWYRLRNAVRHLMLQPLDVQKYLPEIQSVADELVEALLKKRNFKNEIPTLEKELSKYSQEAAGFICFDRRLGCFKEDNSRFIEDIFQANRAVFYLSTVLKFSFQFHKHWSTPKWNELVRNENIIMRNATQLISEAIASMDKLDQTEKNQNKQFPFLTSLLAKEDISLQDVAVITMSLFTDGLSTTVPSLLFNLYNLAKNQDAQEKAYEEILEVTQGSATLTASMVNRMTYLKAVVKETFRVLPNGTEIARILKKDHILSGFLVPAETIININMSVHFTSEKYFKNPEIFQPERWLRGNEESSTHPFVLTPFGHGTRTCIGRRFAEQDMIVILSKILQTFILKNPVNGEPLETVYHTLLFPRKPLKVQFIPR